MAAAAARFVTRFALALALTGGVAVAGVVMVNRTVQREIDRIPRVEVQTAPAQQGGANYLIVGSDSRQFVETAEAAAGFGDPRKETGRRSDTMMVVHVDPDAGRTLVVSFPRDLWVDIPGIGNAKINAAYNTDLGGGPDAIIAALKRNFDLDINHYVEVDFVTFESMVNSVGRVPIYLDRPVVDEFTGFFAVKAGCYYLDGTQALAWVRSRHLRSYNPQTGRFEEDARADIGRIERQQDFIRRLAALVVETSLGNPLKARDIVHNIADDLRVDRGFDARAAFDLIEAFRSLNRGDTSALEFVTFPFTEGNAGGQAVLFPDDVNAAPLLERMRRFDDVAPTAPVQPADVRVEVRNGSSRAGLAQEVMNELVSAGFVKGATGNDQRGRVAVTEVRYANGAEGKARLLLQYVGASAKLVGDPTLDDADVVLVLGVDFNGLQASATSLPASSPPTSAPDAGGANAPVDTAAAAAACR
jgi:LCP family protein required for cell wall assembly